MDPSLFSSGNNCQHSAILQSWQKYGECPEGTVPIRRIRDNEIRRKPEGTIPVGRIRDDDIHERKPVLLDSSTNHEYATASLPSLNYMGASTTINIWPAHTEAHEYSSGQVWLVALTGEYDQNINAIEAGWIVHPDNYRDARPRFFIHWTRDGYKETGCYDLDCSGFVQISKKTIPGRPFKYQSINDRTQYIAKISVYLKEGSDNWWLEVLNETMGYWPRQLFSDMGLIETIRWGREIVNLKSRNHHTTTQMESDHFSSEGYKKVAFLSNLQFRDIQNTIQDADLSPDRFSVTNKACYDLTLGESETSWGTHFYYGCPGRSESCP